MEGNFKYTWIPDMLDFRDYPYVAPAGLIVPSKVDIRNQFRIVHNQGPAGSCAENAGVVGFDFTRVKENLLPLFPSRLFVYYNVRVIENTVNEDAGSQIRDVIKTIYNTGVCREKLWDYNIASLKKKPHVRCYAEAASNKLKQYMRIDNTNITLLKSCLAEGFGFIFGFAVYDSFETYAVARTGIVPMPKTTEKLLGGHAVFCVGFDDSLQCFICRNSWGIGWGDRGHFYMPYEYITSLSLCDDFWTMRLV